MRLKNSILFLWNQRFQTNFWRVNLWTRSFFYHCNGTRLGRFRWPSCARALACVRVSSFHPRPAPSNVVVAEDKEDDEDPQGCRHYYFDHLQCRCCRFGFGLWIESSIPATTRIYAWIWIWGIFRHGMQHDSLILKKGKRTPPPPQIFRSVFWFSSALSSTGLCDFAQFYVEITETPLIWQECCVNPAHPCLKSAEITCSTHKPNISTDFIGKGLSCPIWL